MELRLLLSSNTPTPHHSKAPASFSLHLKILLFRNIPLAFLPLLSYLFNMTTTNVFAELLIIGIETMAWIALLIFSLWGYGWIDFAIFNNLVIAIPLAAAAYVLGIMMDRVSDGLLAKADHAIRKNVLGERAAKSFSQLRSYVLAKSPYLSTDLDYLRSRLRIMRSSTINFGFLALTGAAFILTRVDAAANTKYWAAATAFFTGMLLSSLSYYAWSISSLTYYLRLQTAFALLPDDDAKSNKEEKPASTPIRNRGGNGHDDGNGASG
jgi:hypothetical protein